MSQETSPRHDLVIVGAGWTGLICAKTYLDLAPETDVVILDNGKSVGGVWSKERLYPDLYAQVSHPLFEYSFYPMPKEGITKDGYVSGKAKVATIGGFRPLSGKGVLPWTLTENSAGYTINKYLHDFANDFNLTGRIKLETSVTNVSRSSSDDQVWILTTSYGPQIQCAKLIWAVGPTSSAVLPSWPQTNFCSPVIHSVETGVNLAKIANVSRATVVGSAKSSLDTVYLLLKAGKKVDWIIREDGAGPLAMAAPTFFGVWNIVDVISTRALASFSPSIMNTEGALYNAIQRTRIGRMVAKACWRFVAWFSDRAAGYGVNENMEKLRPTPKGYGMFWARAGLGTASAPDFWKTLHNGDMTVYRSEIESLSNTDVVNLTNGVSVQSDMVIACTGFEKPYRPFTKELREELGLSYSVSQVAKWAELDARGDLVVDEKLPFLKENAPPMQPLALPLGNTCSESSETLLHGPNRHYRRLVPLELAERNDRSICFPGVIHVIFTPTVSEMQALWTAAFMLGKLDLPPDIDNMEMEVAMFNAWTRKRYLEQGRKHAYAIYDYLSYIDTLSRDLGIDTARKRNLFEEMFVRYKPSDYRTAMDEFLAAQENGKMGAKKVN